MMLKYCIALEALSGLRLAPYPRLDRRGKFAQMV